MLTINAYCKDWGWLFNDLRASLECVTDPDVRVLGSTQPLPSCDAYIAIRTDEALDSPDPSRTIVQWHDYRPHPAVWERIEDFAALQTVNSQQRVNGAEIHCWPIGARGFFRVRQKMPEKFTLGWVGRDVVYQGRHIKRPELFTDLILSLRLINMDVAAHFYGPAFGQGNLTEYARIVDGTLHTGARGPDLVNFYHGIDALVVTCEPEPGPLPIYEALRCGIPVITTPTGAAKSNQPGVFIREPEEFAAAAIAHSQLREQHFHVRHAISKSVEDLTQERWARFTVNLAKEVAK